MPFIIMSFGYFSKKVAVQGLCGLTLIPRRGIGCA